MNSTNCSIEKHLGAIKNLSALIHDSFGPTGKSVLFERNGAVMTSQDGTEILSTVNFSDPLLKLIVSSAISSASEFGDGSKLFILLYNNLLRSLFPAMDGTNHVRRRMINCLYQIHQKLMPLFKENKAKYEVINLELAEDKNILFNFIIALLITKFSKHIAEILAELLSEFVTMCHDETAEEILMKAVRDPSLCIVEIPELPISMSKILKGFLITRNFRYLECIENVNVCSFILWSCPVEQNKSEHVEKIQVSSPEKLHDSYFFQMQLLANSVSILKEKHISLIISSVYFPDWAVSICRRFKISIIDMVKENEFEFLMERLNINPVTSQSEVCEFDQIGKESFSRFLLGSSKFVKISISSKQVLICAPTLSHCHQYAKASYRVLKYMINWISDTKYSGLCTKSTIKNRSIDLCFIPCGHHITLNTYKFLLNSHFEKLKLEKGVMAETLKGMLTIYYNKRQKVSDGTLIHFLAQPEVPRVKLEYTKFQTFKSHESSVENPFVFGKILSKVIETMIQVLKIETVIHSHIPVKSLQSVTDIDRECEDI